MRSVTLYTLQAREVSLVGPQDYINFICYNDLAPIFPYGSGDRVDLSDVPAAEVAHCRVFRYGCAYQEAPGKETRIEESFIAMEPRLEEVLRGACCTSEATGLRNELAIERRTISLLGERLGDERHATHVLQVEIRTWERKAEEWSRRPLWRRLWGALKGERLTNRNVLQ